MIDPQIALTVLACTATGLFLWWMRERRLEGQRRGTRALYSLNEEIISCQLPSEILRRLLATLPRVSQVSRVRLYLHNKKTKTLDRIPSTLDPEPLSLPLDADSGAPVCLRNRILLAIPDTRRSPLYDPKLESDPPRTVVFVPMTAEDESLGVLELDYAEGVRQFSQDQKAAARHLGDQVGIALKLREQQSIREQLLRSEKLAAAGQLASGVVTELQNPLETVAKRASQLLERHGGGPLELDLRTIAAEAERASGIVSRLVSFSGTGQAEAKPVDLNDLLSELMEFREREWKVRGIRVRNLLDANPIIVLGAEAQLQQALLNLLVHAEQSLEEAVNKTITISTRLMAQRALIDINYPAKAPAGNNYDPFQNGGTGEAGKIGLAVSRGIIQSHGGKIRLLQDTSNGSRFEIELPAAADNTREDARMRSRQHKSSRQLTVLLLEPDLVGQRHLSTLLSGRGHRVVPVANSEEATDLAQRLRFDLALCSLYLPGSNWVEFFERIRHLVGGFILLTESNTSDVSRAFQGSEGYVLRKPVDETEFDRLFTTVESFLEKSPAASF